MSHEVTCDAPLCKSRAPYYGQGEYWPQVEQCITMVGKPSVLFGCSWAHLAAAIQEIYVEAT